jgi:hypothetical protein
MTAEQQKIATQVNDNLSRMRFFRKQYDQRRAFYYRQYVGQRDQKFFPDNTTPRSNTFVPYPLSNVETIVSRVLDAFFSFKPFFETRGRTHVDDAKAESMQTVLEYMLHRGKFIQAFECLLRNIAIYGHAGIKVDWDWDFETVVYPEPVYAQQTVPDIHGNNQIDPQTGQPVTQPIVDPNTGQPVITHYQPQKKQIKRNCPKFIPIDVFDLLIDPDGGIIAHLTERTLGDLRREAEANPNLYFPDGIEDLIKRCSDMKDSDSVIIRLAEYWNSFDQTCTIQTFGEDAQDSLAFKDLRAAQRGTGYSSWKRKAYAGPPIMLWHGENQFLHRKPPILATSYIKIPNEVFGLGAIEVISDLTEGLNRFANMITDNWNLGINKRYAYNTEADVDLSQLKNVNVPGGLVEVTGNPNEVIAPLPSFTPSAQDYSIIPLYKDMVENASGISDFYARGVGSSGGNSTATGISSVVNESNYRFKMFIRNLELDILQPLLEMVSSMVQQFCTDDVEFRITRDQPQIPKYPIVTPEDLIGCFDFDIVAANYASNKQVRQRNLLAFANVVGNSPFWNQYEANKELAKVFEIANIDRLLYTPQQVSANQAQQRADQAKMMIFEASLKLDAKEHLQEQQAQLKAAYPVETITAAAKVSTPKTGRPQSNPSRFEQVPSHGITSDVRQFSQEMGAQAQQGIEGQPMPPQAGGAA